MGSGAKGFGDTTSPASSYAAGAVIRVQQLCVVHAPGDGRTPLPRLVVSDPEIVIGREPQGARSLTLDDPRVSRRHAVLRCDPTIGAPTLTDCGSSHGTFVDGARTEQARLEHGTVVRVGDCVLIFVDTRMTIEEARVLAPETPALLGPSVAMQRVRGEIGLVARRPLPVLILGQTGVGKERVAAEVHRLSGRTGAFVALNCAAIPAALAETELFGHAAGAFTGATHKHDGVLVAAHGGTLFLDEIAELPPAVQPKLLRALATGEVRAVGRTEAHHVDVRLVAATHADMQASVSAGGFRGDLLARITGWTLHVPPLAHRRDDVLHLASAFLARQSPEVRVAASCAEALALYAWPFNVRELEHTLAAASVRAVEGVLKAEHLPEPIARPVLARARPSDAPAETPLALLVPPAAAPDADGLRLVADRFHGNVSLVAEYFGKDRKQVYRWAEKLGVDLEATRR